jgi:hypothetical protein
MTNVEGWLDYGSGRYKLMGRPGQDDSYFHAGDWLEVWREAQWVVVQVLVDVWGRWYFSDRRGATVKVCLGMRARLVC